MKRFDRTAHAMHVGSSDDPKVLNRSRRLLNLIEDHAEGGACPVRPLYVRPGFNGPQNPALYQAVLDTFQRVQLAHESYKAALALAAQLGNPF